jgi:flagellar FliL protein
MADKVEPAAGGKAKRPILWLVIGLVALAGGGAATFFGLRYFKAPKQTAAAPAKKEVKATLNLDPFLVNLADKEEVRFVKVTFQLGLEEAPKESSGHGVFIAQTRDAIISLLGSKTSEQILTTEGKEKLRAEVRDRVNAFLHEGKVVEVYIVDFVVQL